MPLIVILFSLVGLLVTGFLIHHVWQRERLASTKPLICPIGFDCDVVLESKYNHLFFGIKNEKLGFAFYFFVLIFTVISMVTANPEWLVLVYLMTIPAEIFSLILVGIQGFVLKNWCTWCLASAAINVGLYVTLEKTHDLIPAIRTVLKFLNI